MRPQTALIARTHESALGEVAKYLERTETIVHLAPTVRGRVYTLRGVPKNQVDVVVTDDAWTPRDDRDLDVAGELRRGALSILALDAAEAAVAVAAAAAADDDEDEVAP